MCESWSNEVHVLHIVIITSSASATSSLNETANCIKLPFIRLACSTVQFRWISSSLQFLLCVFCYRSIVKSTLRYRITHSLILIVITIHVPVHVDLIHFYLDFWLLQLWIRLLYRNYRTSSIVIRMHNSPLTACVCAYSHMALNRLFASKTSRSFRFIYVCD